LRKPINAEIFSTTAETLEVSDIFARRQYTRRSAPDRGYYVDTKRREKPGFEDLGGTGLP